MKKFLATSKTVWLVLALGVLAIGGFAASGLISKVTSTVGVTQISSGPADLQAVVIGDLTGGAVTVKVYDSASAITTVASQLKYTLALPSSLTQTAWGRVISLGGHFNNGIVVTTDGQSNTLTAAWQYTRSQN
jgi:hypothetical protein